MTGLGVNIDHIATVRNSRGGSEPDPVAAAHAAELGGADAITVHLREDRRHIMDRDVEILSKTIKTRLNLEMAATEEMRQIALGIMPYSITLVPEKRQEITTEGGLDVCSQKKFLCEYVKPFFDNGIIVSLFVDADLEQIKASAETNSPYIEIHTGHYAENFNTRNEENAFELIKTACIEAQNLGLKVNAGHGLNYQNVKKISSLPGMVELNIGHSIISRAVFVGLTHAVRDMKDLIK